MEAAKGLDQPAGRIRPLWTRAASARPQLKSPESRVIMSTAWPRSGRSSNHGNLRYLPRLPVIARSSTYGRLRCRGRSRQEAGAAPVEADTALCFGPFGSIPGIQGVLVPVVIISSPRTYAPSLRMAGRITRVTQSWKARASGFLERTTSL